MAVAGHAGCKFDSVDLRGTWGQAQFKVDVVDTPATRAKGLMFVESLPRFSGMLFVYDSEQTVGFWMKNTFIALDMIFVDGQGIVQKVHSRAKPKDKTTIFGGQNIQYVLEINAGMSNLLGIGPGTQMRHPSMIGSVWPCM
jgi:uncharacterized membrane protein (UPF0127 family)